MCVRHPGAHGNRSLPLYLFENLAQRGGVIQEQAFEDVIAHETMAEYRLVDARLTEQLASGTMRIQGGYILLTPRGKVVARAGAVFRRNALPRYRLLRQAYTDVLACGLDMHDAAPNYTCRPAQ